MNKLTIRNFKILKDFHIEDLKRVNLIVGRNNVGKTSLLEAIAIFASGGDLGLLVKLLQQRGNYISNEIHHIVHSARAALSTLHSDANQQQYSTSPIEIEESASSNVKIHFLHTPTHSQQGELYEKEINSLSIEIDNKSGVSVHPFSTLLTQAYSVVHKYVFAFQDANTQGKENLAPLYDRIAMTELDQELIRVLNIFEPRIRELNFLSDPFGNTKDRVAYVLCEGARHKTKLSNMGDGINRALFIILSMLNCKGGIFILDEFDNGLHHHVQKQLWDIVFSLAERHHIQVFATTHSNDCVRSFASIAKEKQGKLIRLQERRGDIIAVSYDDASELDYIATSDIETR